MPEACFWKSSPRQGKRRQVWGDAAHWACRFWQGSGEGAVRPGREEVACTHPAHPARQGEVDT